MPAPLLEFDMLMAMRIYMKTMIAEHTEEINSLIIIQRQFKKVEQIANYEATQLRLIKVKGLKNVAHNLVLFINDYLKKLGEKS